MERRRFLLTSLAGAVAAPLSARAQQAAKVNQIGVLWFTYPHVSEPFFGALREGLAALGYAEGKNVAFEQRWAQRDPERYSALVAELVQHRVDVIVAGNLESAAAAKAGAVSIPIVVTAGGDPLRSGLVQSLAHPGGNVTGMSEVIPDLAPKLLELLNDLIPKLSTVAVLWNPANPSYAPTRGELEAAARGRRIRLQSVEAGRPQEIESGIAAISRDRPGGLVVYVTPITQSYRARLIDFAARQRLPAIYSAREFVDDGGLLSYGPNHRELFRRAATFVDKILRGARPADLPIEQPTRFELVVNLKTAKALGLTIPPSVLARADQVIE
jgi:putative tryptophan/tyrosine transport system substrate-binding protein